VDIYVPFTVVIRLLQKTWTCLLDKLVKKLVEFLVIST